MLNFLFRRKNATADDAQRPDAAGAVLQSFSDVSDAVHQPGRLDRSGDQLEQEIAAAQSQGEDDRSFAALLNRLAVVRARQHRYAESERLLKRAISVLDHVGTGFDPDLPLFLSNLGIVYRAMDKGGQARAAFERELRIAEGLYEGADLAVARALDQAGDLDAAEGNFPAAVFVLCRALKLKEERLGQDHWDVGTTLSLLGEVYLKQARYNDAEAFLLREIGIRERVLGWQDPGMAKPLARMALLYSKQRKDGRAEQLVRYALKLFSEALPAEHPEVIGCLKLLAEIYRGLSRFGDADAVWALAQGLLEGTEDRKKIRRFVFPDPPRMSGRGSEAYEPAAG